MMLLSPQCENNKYENTVNCKGKALWDFQQHQGFMPQKTDFGSSLSVFGRQDR
jgi:hypothetical protein